MSNSASNLPLAAAGAELFRAMLATAILPDFPEDCRQDRIAIFQIPDFTGF